MTQAGGDDPASLQYAPVLAPRRNRASIFISWTAIAASVLLIFVFNQIESHAPAAAENGQVAPNVPLEMTARYVVGATLLLPQSGNGSIDTKAAYLKQTDAVAVTAPDRLRETMLTGELSGATAALVRLEALRGELGDAPLRSDAATLRTIYTAGPSSLAAGQRDRLVSRYGWFGRLALSFQQPANDPYRSTANREAIRGFVAMAGLVLLVLAAIGLGIVLFIIALVRFADGHIRRAYVPSTAETSPFLEGFAVYLVGSILLGLLLGRFSGHLHLNLVYLAAACLPVGLALLWPLLRGAKSSDWRNGLGWHAGTGFFREMFWGITVYIAGLPLIALAALLTIVLSKLTGAQPMHPIVNQAAAPGAALSLYLLAAVFAPIAEESLFRGALFHHLRGRHGWWVSAIIVSLIFASIHPQGWAAIPVLGMIAMTFAAIREWRGTIIASATAHALNNAAVLTVLLIATS